MSRQNKKDLIEYHRDQVIKIKSDLNATCEHDDTVIYERTSGTGMYEMKIFSEHCEECGKLMGRWNDKE